MRLKNDNYATDKGLARWAVNHAVEIFGGLENRGRVTMLEPCCGDNAPFASAAKELGMVPYGFDIRNISPSLWNQSVFGSVLASAAQFKPMIDISYTEISSSMGMKQFDLIATNPPFSLGEQVVRRSLDCLSPDGVAVFLVKMAFLGTQDRSRLYISRPPAEVWILTARPSFTGDGQTDVAQEYAFVFWRGTRTEALLKDNGLSGTKLYWLDNKPLMRSRERVRIEKGADVDTDGVSDGTSDNDNEREPNKV